MKHSRIYYFFFLIFFALHFIQSVFAPFKLVGLEGAFAIIDWPTFSVSSFYNGTYQTKVTTYVKQNLPFAGDWARLSNQINYSVFNDMNTLLTQSEDGYLFDPSFLKAANGEDLIPTKEWTNHCQELTSTVQFLDSQNINFLFVIGPNKALFYQEKIPNKLDLTHPTNYKKTIKLLEENQVPYIDFNRHFISQKALHQYPIYPKYGAHWSYYGGYLAADSVLSYLNTKSPELKAKGTIIKIDTSNVAQYTDDDYLPMLNLMSKPKSPPHIYPRVHYTSIIKPKVLVIGDSFFWNFYQLGLVSQIFHPDSRFHFYNKSTYNIKREKISDKLSFTKKDISQFDQVIFMCASANLPQFGFNFFSEINKISK